MSSVLRRPSQNELMKRSAWLYLISPLIGLLALYLPTYWDLAHSLWRTEENGHGPLILGVAIWFAWRNSVSLRVVAQSKPALRMSWVALLFGLALYVVGRSQDIASFEVASQIPVLAAILLVGFGVQVTRAFWFPLLFLVFMIPIPGFIVDSLTGPLKQQVSSAVEQILYAAGYPIARSGVVLTIGHYQLLVADACSGLNSIFSLAALGVLYLYLMRYRNVLRNLVILAAIIPIAIAANIVRTAVLVLVTYHFGGEAGQGFLHSAAGLVLFVAALGLFFAVDSLLGLSLRWTKQRV